MVQPLEGPVYLSVALLLLVLLHVDRTSRNNPPSDCTSTYES